jgi:hypothetical protein
MYIAMHPSHRPSLTDLQTTIVDLLCGAQARGIPVSDLGQLLASRYYSPRLSVACVEENLDHLAAIASMTSRDYAVHAASIQIGEVTDVGVGAVLLNAVAAVTTSFLAARVRPIAERHGIPVFVATMKEPQGIEIMRSMADRQVFVIGLDRRWAERAASAIEASPGPGNLRTIVLGEDDLSCIPPDADVYVTPPAAPAVAKLCLAARTRVLEYWLPPSEARGLISTIVGQHSPSSAVGAADRESSRLGDN